MPKLNTRARASVKPSVKQQRISPVKIVLIFTAVAAMGMMLYFPDYARLHTLRQANAKMRQDISRLEDEIDALKEKIERVGNDPLIYEKVAREELGAVKEGEIVVDIGE